MIGRRALEGKRPLKSYPTQSRYTRLMLIHLSLVGILPGKSILSRIRISRPIRCEPKFPIAAERSYLHAAAPT